jgi:hypothetical protein
VSLLDWSCGDAAPPSNNVYWESIELMKFVCKVRTLCILGPSPLVPGLDIFETLTAPTLMKCWLLAKPCAICDFPRENEELQLEQELSRQSDSKIGTT